MKSDTLIKSEGMKTLRFALGLVDAERFITLIHSQPFDYTEWQMKHFESIPIKEFFESAQRYEQDNIKNQS